MTPRIAPIIEALLFAADAPLPVERMLAVFADQPRVDAAAIRTALNELAEEYRARDGGFHLVEVAGGWRLVSRPEYKSWIQRLLQSGPSRLSKAALETLAVIAYRQPVIRSDIEHIRGVDCGGVLRVLMERKLIRIMGRKEIPGRPLIYGTTRRFLEIFGLRDLNDLPTLREIEDMSGGPLSPADPGAADDPNAPMENGDAGPAAVSPDGVFPDRETEAGSAMFGLTGMMSDEWASSETTGGEAFSGEEHPGNASGDISPEREREEKNPESGKNA